MITKSERRRLELKEEEWRKSVRAFNRRCGVIWCEVKYDMKKIIDWYWFNNEKTDGGKALHIIMWVLITRALIKLFYNV